MKLGLTQDELEEWAEVNFWPYVYRWGALILDTYCWHLSSRGGRNSAKQTSRYSIIRLPENASQKFVSAHRFSYLLVNEIPDDMLACHRCDNTRCVNPDHIFIGTHADSTKDKQIKRRGTEGRSTVLRRAFQNLRPTLIKDDNN